MKSESVIAMVRIRPLNTKEKNENSEICIKVLNEKSL